MKHSCIIVITIIWLAFIMSSCHSKAIVDFENTSIDFTTNAIKIPIKDLAKKFKSLHGQYIRTEGILYWEFENVSICKNRNVYSDGPNCFWLHLHKDLNVNHSLLMASSGKTFVLKGMMDTSGKGHFSAYIAAIRNIYFLKQK